MDRQRAHQLLDHLDPAQFDAISRLLEVMVETDSAGSEIDDEPETEQERHAIASSKEWLKNNPGIPFEQVVAELGFSMAQIRGHQSPA